MRLYPQLPRCDRGALFHKRDSTLLMATDEVLDFLYGLVRLVKPLVCVETGTHHGDSAEAIGRALSHNGLGRLTTCDTDAVLVTSARARLAHLPVTVVTAHGDALLATLPRVDFAFIDSGSPAVRTAELKLLGDHNISPLGIVAWHDACVDYQGLYEEFITRGWPHLVFPSLVGLAVFQRPA